ncbi:baeRF2 domain-containing protein [Actinacidiphila yeochonensis]|uniref:baeRF2 domain-containing protein n=1 Tax=Actinacidiphila yeochonensis TaxID=89050 RepID=UPI000569D380|nr:Vms1/Ankzf1 family peptidyl-tRNA hydrolase [Actinacidiphila yeochonensis]
MDLALLRPLYTPAATTVSVHLDTSRLDQDADKRVEVVWRDLRGRLAGQGVDEATLGVLEEAVGGAPHVVGPQGESLFAAEGRLLGAFTLAAPPARARAVAGPVPDPLETVLDLDHQVPYVVVALDREGGDIDAYPAGAFDPATSRTYDGGTLHITRVRAGGASMSSYHRRTLNLWTENAAGVVEEIAQAVREVDAPLVFVGGDPKAVGVLRPLCAQAVPQAELVDVAGGRGGADALASLREAVDEALAGYTRRSHELAMEAFEAALEQDTAVHGFPAVTEAFAAGNVRTLLLAADRAGDPALWGAPDDPRLLGSAREALGAHAASAFEAPAGALLLRAAVLSGAGFSELLPGRPADDGCAAVLRYAD